MNVPWLNNHHVEQGRGKISGKEISHSSRSSHTPTRSETTDININISILFYLFQYDITFKRFKPLVWGHAK